MLFSGLFGILWDVWGLFRASLILRVCKNPENHKPAGSGLTGFFPFGFRVRVRVLIKADFGLITMENTLYMGSGTSTLSPAHKVHPNLKKSGHFVNPIGYFKMANAKNFWSADSYPVSM